jgi:hypothetical protein
VDFLIEALIQIVVQILGELVIEGAFHGVAAVLRRQVGRWITGSLMGLGFGLAWGRHLSGATHYPRLLWVSLALTLVALVLALERPRSERSDPRDRTSTLDLKWLVTPPWKWGFERLYGFAFINAGIAVGVLAAFSKGPT